MDARFKLTIPTLVEVTLTLTGEMHEFVAIRDSLTGDQKHGAFWRQLNDLIAKTELTLAAETWTTGYAKGVVGDDGEKK